MKSVLLAFALLFSLVYAARASADECGGTLVNYEPARNAAGQKVGEIALYYNAANGNNCVVFNHSGPTWGVSLYTYIALHDCGPTGSTQGATCTLKSKDANYYLYRAGPIRMYGAGRRVIADGYINYRGEQIRMSALAGF